MNILLYYPPLVIPSIKTPYPSLPILSGYLKDNSHHNVFCRDINADFINRLITLSKSQGIQFSKTTLNNAPRIKQSLYHRLYKFFYKQLKTYYIRIFWKNGLSMPIEEVEYLTIEGLKIILEDLSIDLKIFDTLKGNDSQLVFLHYLFDYYNLTYDQLHNIIQNQEPDPIYGFLGEKYFNEIIAQEKLIVGISVPFFTQFGATLSLAKYIKKLNPNIFIVVGGGVIRHVSRNFKKISEIFDIINCFAETEGEEILLELADTIDRDENWKVVSGIIYRNNHNQIIKNAPKPFDVNKNSIPDYSFYYNHKYLEPYRLDLRTSIGCYWNKCKFCTQALSRYKQRKAKDIVYDMSIIAQKYKLKRIKFCDEAVPIPELIRIADLLIKRDIPVKWSTYSKFDAKLTDSSCEKLKESGCIGLQFGLESASQRVNDLMNKGVNVKNAQNIMDILKKHGISCNVSAMIGFPGETQEEMLETIGFLKSNFSPKFSAYISIFSLNYGSYVYNNPEEFSITYIEDDKDYFYKENHYFECKNQVPYETMMKIRNRY